MAPRIDPSLRVGSRRAAPSVVHAVGMAVLDLSCGTVRNIDRVPGSCGSKGPWRTPLAA